MESEATAPLQAVGARRPMKASADGALPGTGRRVPDLLRFGEDLHCVTAVA